MVTQHFDSSIEKIDKDGNVTLSSTLDDGEQLYSDYLADRAAKNGDAPEQENNPEVPAENVDPDSVDDTQPPVAGYEGGPEAAEAAANAPETNDEVSHAAESGVENEEGEQPDENADSAPEPEDYEEDGTTLKQPTKSAAKSKWVNYAKAQGYDESEGLTHDQLVERYYKE
jgi:hypothetical protein